MSLRKQIAVLSVLLCVAGAVASVLFALALTAFVALTGPTLVHDYKSDISFVGYVAAVASVVAVPATLLIGCPAFFLLRKVDLLSWWLLCVIGVIAGALIGTTDIAFGFPRLAFVGLGCVAALVAWLLVTRFNIPLHPTAYGVG